MKVLFIVTRFPVAVPTRGDEVRSRNLLAELAQRHELTVAAIVDNDPGEEERRSLEALGVAVEVITLPRAGTVLRLASGLWDRRPWQVLLYSSAAARLRVAGLVNDGGFDLIHAQLVRAGPFLPVPAQTLVTVDLVDALSWNYSTRGRRPWPPTGLLNPSEAKRLAGYEHDLLTRADAAFVVSEPDWAALGSMAHVEVVPNGVRRPATIDAATREPGVAVFSGNLGYAPNIEAAQWLAKEIFPRIRDRAPGARLRIVGARPDRRVARLASLPGVEVIADVPDMAAALAAASVAVAPMRSGSGLQNKVLEAIVAGTPVVTTSLAANALGLGPGTGVTVADDGESIARAVVHLLADGNEAHRMAQLAAGFVVEKFTWAEAASRISAVWQRLAGH